VGVFPPRKCQNASRLFLPLYYHRAVRKKRSISMPDDLDAAVEAAAAAAGMTYSGWLAAAARKELRVREGLAAVAEWEAEHGPFSAEERAEAEAWVRRTVPRSTRSGARASRPRSA